MTTDDIMQLALSLVGMTEIPPDSEVYVPGTNIRRVLFGIDIGVPELLLAKQLGCDAALAHHPQAHTVTFPEMLWRHAELLESAGVAHDAARRAVAPLVEAAAVRIHRGNVDHVVRAAELLAMPLLSVHNPSDELGRRRLARAVEDDVTPASTVADVVRVLESLPELARARTRVAIRLGDPEALCGRVAVAHGAGTNGGAAVARAYFDHGIGAVVYIHVEPEALAALRADGRGALVVTGHIASDMLGCNPLLDALEARGVEVVSLNERVRGTG